MIPIHRGTDLPNAARRWTGCVRAALQLGAQVMLDHPGRVLYLLAPPGTTWTVFESDCMVIQYADRASDPDETLTDIRCGVK